MATGARAGCDSTVQLYSAPVGSGRFCFAGRWAVDDVRPKLSDRASNTKTPAAPASASFVGPCTLPSAAAVAAAAAAADAADADAAFALCRTRYVSCTTAAVRRPPGRYSPSGDVTAPLVYANYGRPEDFDALDELGVSVEGAIVITRYGEGIQSCGYRAFKRIHGCFCAIYWVPPSAVLSLFCGSPVQANDRENMSYPTPNSSCKRPRFPDTERGIGCGEH